MRRPKRQPTSYRRRLASWPAVALVLLGAPATVAESPRQASAPEAPAAEAPAPAGLRAYIDPVTGELTSEPSPRQVEALSRSLARSSALSRSSEGLRTFELSLGGRGVHLKGRFRSALVLRLDGHGGSELVCTDDPEHATAPPAPQGETTKWEEK